MQQQTIAQSPDFRPGAAERRIDLDWVRIAAFGLLIFYHVGMLYVSWGFHIKSAHRITALEPLMLVLNPWRLALLFLVSGVATRFMLRKYALGPLLRSRSARLLIPLVFGMLVIVPPQSYEQIVESSRLSGRFRRFLSAALSGVRLAILPEPLHRDADVEPSLVRGLSVGLHHGVGRACWRRFPAWSNGSSASSHPHYQVALLLVAPPLAVRDLPARSVPEFPLDACAVRRLVQSRAVRNRLPDRLSARARGRLSGTPSSVSVGWRCRWRRASFCRFSSCVRRGTGANAAEGLRRHCLWLLSMALHRRRARLRAALAHGGFGGAALSDRCDLPLLHRAPDRDHHDRPRVARTRIFRPGSKPAS